MIPTSSWLKSGLDWIYVGPSPILARVGSGLRSYIDKKMGTQRARLITISLEI